MLVIKDKTVKSVMDLSILDEVVNNDTLCLTSVCCKMSDKNPSNRVVKEAPMVTVAPQHA